MRTLRPVAFLCLLSIAACSSRPEPSKILVVGLDGMDPRAVDLLMSEGKMPNFAKLRQAGAYGRFRSQEPMLSPILWTTIATGKSPTEHGIGHFVTVNQKTGEELPVTSQMRKTKAVWNIFSDAGKEVGVVGYWATWPAETVRGSIVSDHACYHFLLEESAGRGQSSSGTYYPPELEKEVQSLIRRPDSVTTEEAAPYIHVSEAEFKRPFNFKDEVSHFKWVLATADSYKKIGLHLLKEKHPDLLMVYIEGTDSTAHLFGHLFRAGALSGELAEQQKRYGDAVEGVYQYADRLVGEFMQAMDDKTTLVVLSDHGFELGKLQDDPSKTRDMRRVSERFHNIEGILYLYGKNVKPRALLDRPSLPDIAPTILSLAGLPAAADMPGRILVEGLQRTPRIDRVPSYEGGAVMAANTRRGDPSADPAIMDQLKSLGYIGDTRSTTGERNLAAIEFQNGRYAEAAEAYRKLIADKPEDAGLRTSLAGALGAQGKYEEALKELGTAIKLEPLNPEAYHNRGVIFERKNDRAAAIKEYRTAVRYSPQYQPSRDALTRLTGSANPYESMSDSDRLAAEMAERAADDARHGDYQAAMKKLDEAERTAPRLALLQQYRSNVAYLQGDSKAAIAALEKAIKLEPDNALYRENLRRLKQGPKTAATPRRR